MYVIYVNDRQLTLLSKEELRTCDQSLLFKDVETHLTANYSGKPRTLLHYADMLEKGSPKVLSVAIVFEDLDRLWEDFRSKYKWVPAAGGVVRNVKLDKTLFIFRRGSWDLPKGKIDDGENSPSAALREVEEETGVENLSLGEELPTTYHTYRNRKGKRVLKPTYWFRMITDQEALVPETEEDIERAEWRVVKDILNGTEPLYQSLRKLLESL
jgi:8-oxo-dGTP pyrophosphatase MutT (NUDIX family)